MKRILNLSSVVVLALVAMAQVSYGAPAKYKIDGDHSKVGFSVRHLMISDVAGRFKKFDGAFTFDLEKGTVSDATFSAEAASIDTDNAKRDDHLRGPDFFDAQKFPKVTFTNSKITKAGKDAFKWTADMTMHGVTKPVTLDLEYKGAVKDPWGMQRAGFTATGKINRKDFGLNWNKALESGGVVVGEDVKLILDIEAIQQTDAAAAPAAKK